MNSDNDNRKGLLRKVRAIVSEDFSRHKLSTEGHATLTLAERFIHFWVFSIKSFIRNRCMIRASALAYSNLLALVPMLAIAISVSAALLKEDGEQKTKIKELTRWVVNAIVPVQAQGTNSGTNAISTNLQSGMISTNLVTTNSPVINDHDLARETQTVVEEQIDNFVKNIRGGALSTGGMILLIYLVITMLGRVEDTFNDIWGVHKGRNWFARITTYWAAMTLGPLLLIGAMTINSGQEAQAFMQKLESMPYGFDKLFSFFVKLLPFLMLSFGFTLFYKLMPNTRVHWRAAFIGGICGGTLWQVNNLMFVFYVSRIVTNNKIYGSLGMVPVMMISLYLGWLFLLFGAQFAYAFQNRRAYVQERLVENLTPTGRELVALRIMTEVAKRFHAGEGPSTAEQISHQIGVPSRLIVATMDTLIDDMLVFEVNEEDRSYLPARPLWSISFADIIEAVRNGTTGGSSEPVEFEGDRVAEQYRSVIQAEMKEAGRTTLQSLAEEQAQAQDSAVVT